MCFNYQLLCSLLYTTYSKNELMLQETQYRHPLQDGTTKLATRVWQTALDSELTLTESKPKAPQVIYLGFLINGYARNPGHYASDSNLIVLNQRHKTLGMNERLTITHELAHWLQHRLDAYRITRDTHSRQLVDGVPSHHSSSHRIRMGLTVLQTNEINSD